MQAFNGSKETQATVAAAFSAFQEAYSYLQRNWGTVTCTEHYDPKFVDAKNHAKRLGAIYLVKREALAVGQ